MFDHPRHRQCVAPRSATVVPAWALVTVRALLLLAIALLPVQMRAGANEAHPHSILQLILDARDGTIDHHAAPAVASHGATHEVHGPLPGECVANPDVPSVEETGRLGGISLLFVSTLLMPLPAFGGAGIWPSLPMRRGRQPELDPPPPRLLVT